MLYDCSITCTLGLIPFSVLAVHNNSLIGALVTFNGVLFHMFYRRNRVVKYYDILCNMLLILYVNLVALDKVVLFWTCMGVIGFLLNTISNNSDITHVLAVQSPLALALHYSGQ